MLLDRLFINKAFTFWALQLSGWFAFGVLNYVTGLTHGKNAEYYLIVSGGYAIIGFVWSLALREIYRLVWNRSLQVILPVAIISIALVAIIFSVAQTWVFIRCYPTHWSPQTFAEYIGDLPYSVYVFVAWTGLYFGIKYYRMLQQQTEKTLLAQSSAHQAQLKMLRYQLNPHFLFNTLNAISTLVLEREVKTANSMVTKLSDFLRYSLDSDPMQKVTFKQELDALNLYLSIEKLRFDERLRLDLQIDAATHSALVPSLFLQPLIENAIKYAVAPQEQGATITLTSSLEEGKFCVTLEDDGPGPQDHPQDEGSGVGLANTKERLSVLYGSAHSVTAGQREDGERGFAVKMCLPHETR